MAKIDVRECEYYGETLNLCTSSCANTYYYKCEKNPNCYYKQLKRLEQENQELGKIIECKNGTIASLVQIRDELKQENKKLKEALEEIKNIIDNDFTKRYMELSFNEYDAILEQIEKICEVLKDE